MKTGSVKESILIIGLESLIAQWTLQVIRSTAIPAYQRWHPRENFPEFLAYRARSKRPIVDPIFCPFNSFHYVFP